MSEYSSPVPKDGGDRDLNVTGLDLYIMVLNATNPSDCAYPLVDHVLTANPQPGKRPSKMSVKEIGPYSLKWSPPERNFRSNGLRKLG